MRRVILKPIVPSEPIFHLGDLIAYATTVALAVIPTLAMIAFMGEFPRYLYGPTVCVVVAACVTNLAITVRLIRSALRAPRSAD